MALEKQNIKKTNSDHFGWIHLTTAFILGAVLCSGFLSSIGNRGQGSARLNIWDEGNNQNLVNQSDERISDIFTSDLVFGEGNGDTRLSDDLFKPESLLVQREKFRDDLVQTTARLNYYAIAGNSEVEIADLEERIASFLNSNLLEIEENEISKIVLERDLFDEFNEIVGTSKAVREIALEDGQVGENGIVFTEQQKVVMEVMLNSIEENLRLFE